MSEARAESVPATGGALGAAVAVHAGARATEAALVAAVRGPMEALRLAAAPGAAPGALAALLAEPVRVVVPSRSLREHVAARLARALGGGAAGLAVQTLRRLASELLERAGEELAGAEEVFAVLVRREARREPALRAELDALREGYAAVAGSVSDLLDAGFEPVHGEAVLDALAAAPVASGARARAEALVRVAARTLRALEGLGLSHRAAAFSRAAELLDARPELLPARAVVVHGFADATGSAGALLDALVRHRGALALVDHPPDPADPARSDLGVGFTERLRRRLAFAGARERTGEPAGPAPEVRLREAPGAEAEARAVAAGARALLDEGVEPERIGIVARELGPWAAALRRHLRRLGVPFSGAPEVAHVARPGARALHAVLALLRERGDVAVDSWLAARAAGAADARRSRARDDAIDLRVAFHALGAGRLADAADLDVAARLGGRDWLALPVRHGIAAPSDAAGAEGEDDAGGAGAGRRRRRLRSRSLPGWLLERTVADARASLDVLGSLDARAGFAARRERLEALLAEGLHWLPAGPASRAVARALDGLAAALPEDFELDGAEMALLLERALEGAEAEPLGGAGGGVAVLSVTEARAHTFDALFLLGVGRDAFPRRVVEDPLLPDALRRSLESVLPEIPLKARGFDEERYLFAQLVSSSPRVWISWQATSDDGRARAPSPFVERLHLAGGEPEKLPALFSEADGADALRPAFEHALLAGLRGGEPEREAAFALAVEEARREEGASGGAPGPVLARVRRATREEWDAPAGSRPLGPYLGFIGRRAPDRRPLFVTRLEHFARCPWQALLARDLGLAPLPDALAWRPGSDPLLLGSAVHAALDALVRAAVALPEADALDAALAREAQPLAWPDAAATGRLVREAVAAVLAENGIGLPGYAEALAREVEPAVERARALLGAAPRVLATEVEGAVAIDGVQGGAPAVLHFRADLVEARASGAPPVLTDYKSGKNGISDAVKEETRRGHLADKIASGVALQAMTYAHAVPGATGRYLFLGPDVPDGAREVAVTAGDAELDAAYRGALRALLDARAAGLYPPRLLGRDGASGAQRCDYCDVRDACVRGDSGARARLRAFAEEPARGARGVAGVADPALEALLRDLWQRGGA